MEGSFDGNSIKVAELLVKNGLKEAYAIRGGIRGKKGWQVFLPFFRLSWDDLSLNSCSTVSFSVIKLTNDLPICIL